MIAHGSPETSGKAMRRTLYHEFRAAEQILEEGPWEREWVERRLRLLPVALKRHTEAFPQDDQFVWKIQDPFRPLNLQDEATELRIVHGVHTVGAWCSAGDVPDRK
jgi:phytanoyl-CoA hydroxylase